MVQRNLIRATVVLLLLASLCVAELKAEEAWPQWRGPGRDAISTETGLNTNWEKQTPKLLWMSEGFGKGFASVSIADGRIFTTGNSDKGQGVTAARLSDGKVLWQQILTDKVPKHGYPGSRCTPTVDGDRIYVVLSDGTVACLSVSDGQTVWKKDFKQDFGGKMMSGWGYSESPLVDGAWLLCTPGGADAVMVALDKMTGDIVWKAALPESDDDNNKKRGAGYASIVISNGAGVKQYVQLTGAGLIGVRAADGKVLWSYGQVANRTANIPTPLVQDDYVFASTGYGTGAALVKLSKDGDGVAASEVYFLDSKTMQNHHGGMVLLGGHVYCGHGHGKGFPLCVELESGEIVWEGGRGPGSGSAALVCFDGHLIFRYQSGDVALIEATPEGYKLKGQFKPEFVQGPSWAHPVVAGGKLYLREQDKLMCYDLR